MKLHLIDTLLQRATNLGLAVCVTLAMLGGIDALSAPPQLELAPMAAAQPTQG